MSQSTFDVTTAARDPRFIKDPFFYGSNITISERGKIEMYAGGFSQVFTIIKNGEKWGFKVWTRDIEDIESRYQEISKHLNKVKLPYFSDFNFFAGGLLVNGSFLDTMRIRWIEGTPLVPYICMNLRNSEALFLLAEKFLEMTNDLHNSSVSHGDLHHENIFVCDNGDIKLIDYDSICVPNLEGKLDMCRGRPGYQHPARLITGYLSSLKIDYFSELVIYISILAIAENPILWDKYSVSEADSRLLFRPEDLLNFGGSDIRQDLNMLSGKIKKLIEIFDDYLAVHLKLAPMHSFINDL